AFILCQDACVMLVAIRLDELVLLSYQGGEVHREPGGSESGEARMGRIVDQPRRLDKGFGGQASTVDTCTTRRAHLRHHSRLTKLACASGRCKGGGAAAQDEQVIVRASRRCSRLSLQHRALLPRRVCRLATRIN